MIPFKKVPGIPVLINSEGEYLSRDELILLCTLVLMPISDSDFLWAYDLEAT